MMCDIPSMAIFCMESIECCPDVVSRYFLNFYLQFPGPNDYWHDILYFNFFLASFFITFLSDGIQ
jgi:hypothetical protein